MDPTRTPWDMYQLADWADYGLGAWTVFRAWEFNDSGGLTAGWIHYGRGEMLLIGVWRDFVIYSVTSLLD